MGKDTSMRHTFARVWRRLTAHLDPRWTRLALQPRRRLVAISAGVCILALASILLIEMRPATSDVHRAEVVSASFPTATATAKPTAKPRPTSRPTSAPAAVSKQAAPQPLVVAKPPPLPTPPPQPSPTPCPT